MAKAGSGGTKARRGAAAGAKRVRTRQVEGELEPQNTPLAKVPPKAKKATQAIEKRSKKAVKKAPSKAGATAKGPRVKKAVVTPPAVASEVPSAVSPAAPSVAKPEPVIEAVPAPPATTAAPQSDASETAPAPAVHFDDLPWGECPADLPAPATGERPGLGWMTQVILVSSLLLLLFNSFAVDKWARSLPVSAYSGQVIDAADAWHGMMGRIDFNLPLESGRDVWHWLKALQWPGTAEGPSSGEKAGADADRPAAAPVAAADK